MSITRSKKSIKPKKSEDHRSGLTEACLTAMAGPIDSPDFDLLLGALAREMGAEAATLAVMSGQTDTLKLAAVFGAAVDPVKFLSFGPGSGLGAWAATTGAPILLADRSSLRNFDPENDFGSYLAVPLRIGETPIGVLSLAARAANHFTKTEVAKLDEVKQLLSFTVHSLQLRQMIITTRRSQEKGMAHRVEKLEQAVQWKEARDKIGSLYHNLNDSLAVLVGNAQCLLVEHTSMNQKTVSRVRRIEETSMRLADMGKELLQLRKLISAIGEGRE